MSSRVRSPRRPSRGICIYDQERFYRKRSETPYRTVQSGLLQLRKFLHQLLQPKPRKLYSNLRVFPIALAFVDSPFAVFGVDDPLPRLESLFAGRLGDGHPGAAEFLASRREKFSNVVDGVVAGAFVGRACATSPRRLAVACRLRPLALVLV